MLQTRFSLQQVDPEKKRNLDQKLREFYHNIKIKFKNFGTFQDVLTRSLTYSSKDLKDEQSPEEFAKRNLIEPLIDLLGFEIIPETVLPAPSGKRKPDYTIRPKNQDRPVFYVEAEPLSTDLHRKGCGISQVEEWLLSRASKTDYGIATNGFEWILLKFDTASAKSREILKVSLRSIFLKILNPKAFITEDEVDKAKAKFLTVDCEYVSLFLAGYLEIIEKQKEEISKRFYNDYVRFVFGYDKKGNTIQGACLLNKVITPADVGNNDANLFSVVFMNRLIFIRFLEEKGIVPKNLLRKLLESYKSSGAPGTFYETYLKPVFYEVFNRSKSNRISVIRTNPIYNQIPYLNGGLFREVIKSERNYNIENEGCELVLENLLEKYSFGLETGSSRIDPNILGYIFEKTINFISGTGTNQQKMKGAYYTPDDVVEFIIEETLIPIIFRKMIQGLVNSGWSDADLKGYNSIEDILNPERMPKNPMHIRKMVESIGTIRLLDPACGSGHFLTAALSHILRVEESLLRTIGENVDRYKLKRDIVSQNLFGVDIDENAVEIARLRLWLSIIEEVEDPEHVDTLPNIDFNIFSGNSLIGWLNEKLSTHPLVNLLEDSYIQDKLDILGKFYGSQLDEIRNSLGKMRLGDTIKAYRKLIGMYSLESGERAIIIRELLEEIRNKLYEVINDSYLDFVHENCKLEKKEFDEVGKSLIGVTTFHWKIDFENVFAEEGFDVVVGNPPYGNILKAIEKEAILYFETESANEIAANFIERSLNMVKKNGYIGLVLANSIAINRSTSTARSLIRKYMSESKMALFGTRPAKIFPGAEIRVMIFLGKKDEPKKPGVILTTEAIKFTRDMRSSLLHDLSFESTEGLTLGKERIGDGFEDISLPKVGYSTIRGILLKLKKESTIVIKDRINKPMFNNKMEFRKTGGYWLNALEKMPYESTKVELVRFETSVERDFSVLLINSSLFYLYWSTYGNLRDFPRSLLEKFPFPSLEKLNQRQKEIKELKEKVSECLLKSFLRETGRVGEFRTAQCKDIIDSIDDFLGKIYGLNKAETEFVKKYDSHIRC